MPDLIIGPTDSVEDAYDELQQIAPTVALGGNDWRGNLRLVADASGRRDRAEQIIADHDARVRDPRRRLATQATGTVSILRPFQDGTFTIYGRRTSYAGTVLEELGLERPSSEDGTEDQVSDGFERVGEFGAADVLFVIVGFVGAGVTGRELDPLAEDPCGNGLPAVRAGRVYLAYPAYWIESNPFAIDGVLDDVERHLLAS